MQTVILIEISWKCVGICVLYSKIVTLLLLVEKRNSINGVAIHFFVTSFVKVDSASVNLDRVPLLASSTSTRWLLVKNVFVT